jgi:hypothetical protein
MAKREPKKLQVTIRIDKELFSQLKDISRAEERPYIHYIEKGLRMILSSECQSMADTNRKVASSLRRLANQLEVNTKDFPKGV